jgi:hypothetical protein
MPESDAIDFPNETDKGAALEEFHGTMRASEARLKLVSPEELDSALSTVAEYLRTSWSTGGGGACVISSGACGMDGPWLISSTFLTASMAR